MDSGLFLFSSIDRLRLIKKTRQGTALVKWNKGSLDLRITIKENKSHTPQTKQKKKIVRGQAAASCSYGNASELYRSKKECSPGS